MTARLPSGLLVTALIRRVHDEGGSAMVLAKGDPTGGAILVLATERGAGGRFLERGLGFDGRAGLIETGPRDSAAGALTDYWQRRSARDPDLWVIELDIANAERFAAETIAVG